MKTVIIILAVGFALYLISIYLLFGFIGSISNSYYKLQEKYKAGRIFTLFMAFISISLLIISGLLAAQGKGGEFFFGGGAAALFVGVAAEYYQTLAGRVHRISAALLIIFTAVGLGVTFGNWWPMYFMAVSLIAFLGLELGSKRTKDVIINDVYWYEVLCFVAIMVGLLSA